MRHSIALFFLVVSAREAIADPKVEVVFNDRFHVQFGQMYVLPPDYPGLELDDSLRGQQNGICGAAVPRALFLLTGLHTGWVALVVRVTNTAPPLDQRWEDVVEVSFRVGDEGVELVGWAGEAIHRLAIKPGTYRVRYCARGMDKGQASDTNPENGEIVDDYEVTLWPAEAAPDVIVRQYSKFAAYWHECVRTLNTRSP